MSVLRSPGVFGFILAWCGAAFAAAPPEFPRDQDGDRLPPGAICRMGTTRLRWGRPGGPVALSPCGKFLATGENHVVRLWDVAQGREVRVFDRRGAYRIIGLQFTPDGRHLVAIEDTHPLFGRFTAETLVPTVIEVATGKVHRAAQTSLNLSDLQMVAEGRSLLLHAVTSLDKGEVIVCDLLTGKETRRILAVLAMAAIPGGPLFATGHEDGAIRLRQAATGKVVRSIAAGVRPATRLALSPDARWLAAAIPPGKGHDRVKLRLWDVATGKEHLGLPDLPGVPTFFAFTAEGRTLGLVVEGALTLCEVPSGKPGDRFPRGVRVEPSRPGQVAFAPAGKTMAWKSREGSLHVWDLRTGKERWRRAGPLPSAGPLSFSPDGRLLVDTAPGVRFFDVASGEERHAHPGHRANIRHLLFAPDGRSVITRDESNEVRLWDRASGRALHPGPSREAFRLHRLAAGDEGRTLVGVDDRLRVHRIDAHTGRLLRTFGIGSPGLWRRWLDDGLEVAQEPQLCLALDRDGKFLAVASDRDRVEVHDTRTGRRIARLETRHGRYPLLQFSPDGLLLAVVRYRENGWDVWRLVDGERVYSSVLGDRPLAWAFSPDGRHLAWSDRGGVHLRDLKEKGEPGRLGGPEGGSWTALHFTREGRRLVGITSRGYLDLWDLPSRVHLRRLPAGEDEVHSAHLLSDSADQPLVRCSLDRKHSRSAIRRLPDGREVTTVAAHEDHAPSPDGRILAIHDGSFVFCEVLTGGVIGRGAATGHRGDLGMLTFSPAGDVLATGGRDGTVLLWDWRQLCGLRRAPAFRLDQAGLALRWQHLAGDTRPAWQAIADLAASGDQAVTFLAAHLAPVTEKDGEPVRRAIENLDSDTFAVRREAQGYLAGLSAEWFPLLYQVVTRRPGLEVRKQIEKLLEAAPNARHSTDALRRLRALVALEWIGTPAARALLVRLAAGDAEMDLTREARSTLVRLASRRSLTSASATPSPVSPR